MATIIAKYIYFVNRKLKFFKADAYHICPLRCYNQIAELGKIAMQVRSKVMGKYYIYIIRCEGDELYTGITGDVEKRFNEHLSGKGAKYTKSHRPKNIEAYWSTNEKGKALKLEFRIKQLTKEEKELLIQDNIYFKKYFKGLLDLRFYRRCK